MPRTYAPEVPLDTTYTIVINEKQRKIFDRAMNMLADAEPGHWTDVEAYMEEVRSLRDMISNTDEPLSTTGINSFVL